MLHNFYGRETWSLVKGERLMRLQDRMKMFEPMKEEVPEV
jgi:hypothetical protein